MINTPKIHIEQIQFKRGLRQDLIAVLVGDNKPKMGEPVLELDTHRLKFGNGIDDYEQLGYFNTGTNIDFAINDPITNDLLFFDSESGAWTNKHLEDNESIIYIEGRGLTLSGFNTASNDHIPVKDSTGLRWMPYLSDEKLQGFEQSAAVASNNAAIEANKANSSAIIAKAEADRAEAVGDLTVKNVQAMINGKFWWGTEEAYNKYVEEGNLREGTICFVQY